MALSFCPISFYNEPPTGAVIGFHQTFNMNVALGYNKRSDVALMSLGEIFMNDKRNMLEQLQRFYSLWKEGTQCMKNGRKIEGYLQTAS